MRALCIFAMLLLVLTPLQSFAASGSLPGSIMWDFDDGSDVIFRTGDKDEDGDTDIEELQRALITLGYLSGSADGKYGRETTKAVKEYQRTTQYDATGQVTYDQYWEIIEAAEEKQEGSDIQAIINAINLLTDEQALKDLSKAIVDRLATISEGKP